MAGEDSAAGSARASGLLGSVKGLTASLIAAVYTRLQLFANELASEGLRLRQMALLLVLAVIFFALAVVLLTLLVVVLFWDDHRLLAIGGLALAYLIASAVLLLAGALPAAALALLIEGGFGLLEKLFVPAGLHPDVRR